MEHERHRPAGQALDPHIAAQLAGASPPAQPPGANLVPVSLVKPEQARGSGEETGPPSRENLRISFGKTLRKLGKRGDSGAWPTVEREDHAYTMQLVVSPDGTEDGGEIVTCTLADHGAPLVSLYDADSDTPAIVLSTDARENATAAEHAAAARAAATGLRAYRQGIGKQKGPAQPPQPSHQNLYYRLAHRLPSGVRRAVGVIATAAVFGLIGAGFAGVLEQGNERKQAQTVTEGEAALTIANNGLAVTEERLGTACVTALTTYRNNGAIPPVTAIPECGTTAAQRQEAYQEYDTAKDTADAAAGDLKTAIEERDRSKDSQLLKIILGVSAAAFGGSQYLLWDQNTYRRRRPRS